MCRRVSYLLVIIVLLCGLGLSISAQTLEPIRYDVPVVRVKDVARVQGVRDNQIYGLGLVVGLQGTGDGSGSRANIQMIANMLESFGITVNANDLRLRNIAAVMVTADLPTSLRTGDRLDVTISSIGDARSLQGGFLLQTPLEAANGDIFAVAQGAVSIGGFVARSGGGSSQTSHPTVGIVVNGAIVEQELQPYNFGEQGQISLVLLEPDFTTAARLAQVVNEVYQQNLAWARDRGTVEIQIPEGQSNNVVGFIAELEELPIRPDVNARVVINERTGTVVMGSSVRLATVAVAHGNLKVQVRAETTISHPPSFSDGESVVARELLLDVEEEPSQFTVLGGANVQDLVDALNAVGATPRDIIAILQAVKAAGALFGELLII